ncbi:hypothetical protein, partial [Rhizobium favelukesii]|uniref:hypothetical protein n=1 Tax=Rhizobium favelukesii TaxID=348824 RepID=UPI0021608479
LCSGDFQGATIDFIHFFSRTVKDGLVAKPEMKWSRPSLRSLWCAMKATMVRIAERMLLAL